MAITVWNKHDYVQRLRARINKPTTWTDILLVKYSDSRTIVGGYASTEPTAVAGTRGTAYNFQQFTLTQDTLTISSTKMVPVFIDEADRYQQSYIDQMTIADFQGKIINEKIESLFLDNTVGAATNGTNFGAGDLANSSTDDTTQITVSASNIDDIIRAIKRKINTNNGVDFAVERGYYIVWRPADFEMLEAFVQANGFTEADIALKNGIPVQRAFRYMGVDHYLSTSHTANHVIAGIKKSAEIGILRSTYGRVKFLEDPAISVTTAPQGSGLGIVSRVDYGFNFPAQLVQFTLNVNVS